MMHFFMISVIIINALARRRSSHPRNKGITTGAMQNLSNEIKGRKEDIDGEKS